LARWAIRLSAFAALCLVATFSYAEAPDGRLIVRKPPPDFRKSAWFDEWIREAWLEKSARVVMTLSGDFDATRPTRLVIYTTPNGSTIEQTLGCEKTPELDWHFDIQHVAAQVRLWRTLRPEENTALACIEADGLSWPAWRQSHEDASVRIARIVDTLRSWVPDESTVELTGHSGGGSFIFGFLESVETLPPFLTRIVFLDANYAYDDAKSHGDKLLAWLNADDSRRLIVIAYDDREITLDGKKVVGPTGGTFRATGRMRDRFAKDVTWVRTQEGPFEVDTALEGRVVLYVHANPENKILHTALVGEMNGLLHGLALGRDVPEWGTFGGPRAYTRFVQPAPGIPPRQADAPGGNAVMAEVAGLSRDEREGRLAAEILRGNIPEFLRQWQTIEAKMTDDAGREHALRYDVMPDYLAVGSDADFVRVPLTPQTAQRIADAFGASLPTRKMVDDIAAQAAVRLSPQPLTEDRESIAAFLKHNALIEERWGDRARGPLVGGIKKDVVLSNRLAEKPNRVAIYGWHQLDGSPIQSLTIVHVDWYVDYSHGIRLVRREAILDGKPRDLKRVMHDAKLHGLVSDEGPLEAGY
jgi:hypothetical protein